MNRDDDAAELCPASIAFGLVCRKIMNLTLQTQNGEGVAALVHAIDILIDEVRMTFAQNTEVVAVAEELKDSLRKALWDEVGCTLQ